MMSALRSLSHPKRLMIMNHGIIKTKNGTIKVANMRTNNVFFPGNLYIAKAYPPIEQNSRVDIVTAIAVAALLRKFFQKGITVSMFW
jgi:hypothetical protein